jgi:hypothetical protein
MDKSYEDRLYRRTCRCKYCSKEIGNFQLNSENGRYYMLNWGCPLVFFDSPITHYCENKKETYIYRCAMLDTVWGRFCDGWTASRADEELKGYKLFTFNEMKSKIRSAEYDYLVVSGTVTFGNLDAMYELLNSKK